MDQTRVIAIPPPIFLLYQKQEYTTIDDMYVLSVVSRTQLLLIYLHYVMTIHITTVAV